MAKEREHGHDLNITEIGIGKTNFGGSLRIYPNPEGLDEGDELLRCI